MPRKKQPAVSSSPTPSSVHPTAEQFIVACREQISTAYAALDPLQQHIFALHVDTIIAECRTRYSRFLRHGTERSVTPQPARMVGTVLDWLPVKLSHDRYREFFVAAPLPEWALPDFDTFRTGGIRERWEALDARGITEGARVHRAGGTKPYTVEVILMNCLVALKGVEETVEPTELTVVEDKKTSTV